MSVTRKINLGNYESADAFISISGISEDTTPKEIDAILDGPGAIAYRKIADRLNARIKDMRAEKAVGG